MDAEAALQSIEKDIVDRLDSFIKLGKVPVRVSEVNPLRLTEMDKLEEKAKAEPAFADYLSTWDQDLLSRMTIIDEELDDPHGAASEVGYEDMPPRDYMLRYYVREYEDDIQLTPGQLQLMPPTIETIQ